MRASALSIQSKRSHLNIAFQLSLISLTVTLLIKYYVIANKTQYRLYQKKIY